MAILDRLALLWLVVVPAAALQLANVRKTPAKYIFFAGLEGTGHHFFMNVLEKCFETGHCGMRTLRFLRHANRASLDHNQTLMREIWDNAWGEDETFVPERDVVYPLNPLTLGNMMSYPTMYVDTNPSMNQYHSAAQYFGDSLKVIVMLRNPRALLHSVRSRFEHTEDNMIDSMKVLSAQLRRMPRGSFICVRFEELGNVGRAFQEFMNISSFDVKDAMRKLYKEEPGCYKDHPCSSAKRLAAADEKFREEFCRSAVSTEPGTTFTQLHRQAVRWIMS